MAPSTTRPDCQNRSENVRGHPEFLSQLRHALTVATSIFPRFQHRFRKANSSNCLPSLNAIQEEVEVPAFYEEPTTTPISREDKLKTSNHSKKGSYSDLDQNSHPKSPPVYQNINDITEELPRTVRSSKKTSDSERDQKTHAKWLEKSSRQSSSFPYSDRSLYLESLPVSQDPYLTVIPTARSSHPPVDCKRKSVSFDPTETVIISNQDSITTLKDTDDQHLSRTSNIKDQTTDTASVPTRLTSFASLKHQSRCPTDHHQLNKKPSKLYENSNISTFIQSQKETAKEGRILTSILKRTKSTDDLQASVLTSGTQPKEVGEMMKRSRSVREPVGTARSLMGQLSNIGSEVSFTELQSGVQLRVPVKSLVECFNRKTTEGQRSPVDSQCSSLASKGLTSLSFKSEKGQLNKCRQTPFYDDSGYQSSDSEIAMILSKDEISNTGLVSGRLIALRRLCQWGYFFCLE